MLASVGWRPFIHVPGRQVGGSSKAHQAYEGTTIGTLRRLNELVRQISTAVKAVGNHQFEEKCAKYGEMIRQNIVLAVPFISDVPGRFLSGRSVRCARLCTEGG